MLDLKEEQRYGRLRKLAQELHIPMPEAFLTLEVFDKEGKLIQKHKQRSHSWVRNAYNLMFCQLAACPAFDNTFGAGKLSIKETDGTIRYHSGRVVSIWDYGQIAGNTRLNTPGGMGGGGGGYLAAAASDVVGIVVGSGTNPESFDDYTLQTKIFNGTGVGQLNYVASENHSVSYSGLVLKDELIRYFNNNSGGNVDINEASIYAAIYVNDPGNYVAVCRDKLASTVTVPDTGQLKVTYIIQLTYPA